MQVPAFGPDVTGFIPNPFCLNSPAGALQVKHWPVYESQVSQVSWQLTHANLSIVLSIYWWGKQIGSHSKLPLSTNPSAHLEQVFKLLHSEHPGIALKQSI